MEIENLKIPERLWDKVAAFPESSMGANRIKIDLVNGKRVYDVVVAGDGSIVKVGTKSITRPEDLGFGTADIVDVFSEIK